jgi:hypothetical protein
LYSTNLFSVALSIPEFMDERTRTWYLFVELFSNLHFFYGPVRLVVASCSDLMTPQADFRVERLINGRCDFHFPYIRDLGWTFGVLLTNGLLGFSALGSSLKLFSSLLLVGPPG